MKHLNLIVAFIPVLLAVNAFAKTPVVVLDSGHQPVSSPEGGATGLCGQKEYQFNDEIVEALAKNLRGVQVVLTRKKGETLAPSDDLISFLPEAERAKWKNNPSLYARAAIANRAKADYFISIHHDSVAERFLIPHSKGCEKTPGFQVTADFKAKHHLGFNLFILNHGDSAQYRSSFELAQKLGKALIQMGRVPSNYHRAPDDDCRSCQPIDEKLGIWSQDLAVLRSIQMPGLLLEVGVMVDPAEEKLLKSPGFKQKLTRVFQKLF